MHRQWNINSFLITSVKCQVLMSVLQNQKARPAFFILPTLKNQTRWKPSQEQRRLIVASVNQTAIRSMTHWNCSLCFLYLYAQQLAITHSYLSSISWRKTILLMEEVKTERYRKTIETEGKKNTPKKANDDSSLYNLTPTINHSIL